MSANITKGFTFNVLSQERDAFGDMCVTIEVKKKSTNQSCRVMSINPLSEDDVIETANRKINSISWR